MSPSSKGVSRARVLLGLHLLLGIYSLSDVASKKAAGTAFLSPTFILFYGIVLVLLAVYAIGWQQVIRRMPLSSAYANRAVTVIWGIAWGVVFFGESVTPGKVVGASLIMAGIVLFARSDRKETDVPSEGGEAS